MNDRTSIFRLCLWLLGYARRRWDGLVAVLVTMLLGNFTAVLGPWPMKFLVDQALLGHAMPAWLERITPSREKLLILCVAATVVLFLLQWVISLLDSLANLWFGQSMVYDLAGDAPIAETHPYRPASPYAAAKIGSDMLALSYFHAYRMPVTVVRPFNTYGPFQKSDSEGGVVAIFLKRDLDGQALLVKGKGDQTLKNCLCSADRCEKAEDTSSASEHRH